MQLLLENVNNISGILLVTPENLSRHLCGARVNRIGGKVWRTIQPRSEKNIGDVSELMHWLIEMSHGLQQTLIDEAINEHLQPCVCATGSGQVLF